MSQSTIHAISLRHETISLTLVSEVLILSHKDQPSKGKIFRGIWDTGATGSVITQKIVDQLGLKPTGVAVVQTAGVRDFQTTTYLIDVYLKDGLCIQSINASLGSVTDDIDCLIGMDIICLGDFSITNFQGKTIMSLRIPSQHDIDFVRQINTQNEIILSHQKSGGTMATKCICGSGKKFKNCHGKNLQQ